MPCCWQQQNGCSATRVLFSIAVQLGDCNDLPDILGHVQASCQLYKVAL